MHLHIQTCVYFPTTRHWGIPRKHACQCDLYIHCSLWYVAYKRKKFCPNFTESQSGRKEDQDVFAHIDPSPAHQHCLSALSVDGYSWSPNKVNQLGPLLHPSDLSLSHSLHTPLAHTLLLKPVSVHPHFPLQPRCHLGPTLHQSCHLDTATGHWQSRARHLGQPRHRKEHEWRLLLPPNGASVFDGAQWWSSCRSWVWPQRHPYSNWRTPRRDWEQRRRRTTEAKRDSYFFVRVWIVQVQPPTRMTSRSPRFEASSLWGPQWLSSETLWCTSYGLPSQEDLHVGWQAEQIW